MKHDIRMCSGWFKKKKKCAPPLAAPWPWSSVLFPNREARRWIKGLQRLEIERRRVGLLFSFSGRGYSGKQTSKGKFSLRWAEIGQNVMRPKWGGKKQRKERKEKEEKGLFITRRGSFLKTASNYSAFHTWCAPGSFALYLEPRYFWQSVMRRNWGRCKRPRILWFGRHKGEGNAGLPGTFCFPLSRRTEEHFRVMARKVQEAKLPWEANYWWLEGMQCQALPFLKGTLGMVLSFIIS